MLALKISDDELSDITKNKLKQAKKKTPTSSTSNQQQAVNPYNSQFDENLMPPLTRRTGNVWQIRAAIGLDNRNNYGGGQSQFYAPTDYGEARMASLGFLYEQVRATDKAEGFAKQIRDAKDKAGIDPRPLWDW